MLSIPVIPVVVWQGLFNRTSIEIILYLGYETRIEGLGVIPYLCFNIILKSPLLDSIPIILDFSNIFSY